MLTNEEEIKVRLFESLAQPLTNLNHSTIYIAERVNDAYNKLFKNK